MSFDPTTGIQYFKNKADAQSRSNPIAQNSGFTISGSPDILNEGEFNTVNTGFWRIGSFLYGSEWENVTIAVIYSNGESPSSGATALYPAADRTTLISYYQDSGNIGTRNNPMAENQGSTISPNMVFINDFIQYNTGFWRIAEYWNGTSWVTGNTSQIYADGANLSSIITSGASLFATAYPTPGIQYFKNKADAEARVGTTVIAQSSGLTVGASPNILIPTDYNNFATGYWRLSNRYIVDSGFQYNYPVLFQNGTNLTTIYPDAIYYLLFPAINPTTGIQYFSRYYDTTDPNGYAAAESEGLTISSSPNILDNSFNANNTNSWRIIKMWNGSAWVGSPNSIVYTNGQSISSATSNRGAWLVPAFDPTTSIQYFSNLADANNRTNPIAEETGNYINDGNFTIINPSITFNFWETREWRIAKYYDTETSSWVTGSGEIVSGNLYSITGGGGASLYYDAPVITYYATFSDAVNLSNAIADQQTYIINDSINPYDLVAYSATRLWRIARYRPSSDPNAWEAGPPNVYKIGDDLSSIGNDLIFTLYPVVPCLLEGTNILCQVDGQEVYAPIESLRKGALVKTTNGEFKRIELIAKGPFKNPGHSERIEERLYKCSRSKYPELKKDLYITGCHSILVEELTDEQREQTLKTSYDIFVTDTMYRLMTCLDDRAEPWTSEGEYTVWHLALENEDPKMNYGIYANGLLVESCAINFLKNRTNMTIV